MISVILATYKRPWLLSSTLETLALQVAPGDDYDIIVVDNDPLGSARSVVGKFEATGYFRYFSEPCPGKNAALLTALKHTSADFLVFTDDDVLADTLWLKNIRDGFERHDCFDLFGGKILPYFPDAATRDAYEKISSLWFTKSALAVCDHGPEDLAIPARLVWGPNMAVRRRVLDEGITFDSTIGPTGTNYIVGSESDFLIRAEAHGFRAMYIPNALVHHQIRPEQLRSDWLVRRAYMAGRGKARLQPHPSPHTLFGVPRFLIRKLAALYWRRFRLTHLSGKQESLEARINYQYAKGQIHQYFNDRLRAEHKTT